MTDVYDSVCMFIATLLHVRSSCGFSTGLGFKTFFFLSLISENDCSEH